MCHRLDGEGEDIGPDLSREAERGRSPAWLIGHFKNPPAYTHGSPMPAFENLTPRQLQALVALLENARGSATLLK